MSADVIVPLPGVTHPASPTAKETDPRLNKKQSVETIAACPIPTTQDKTAWVEMLPKLGLYPSGKPQRPPTVSAPNSGAARHGRQNCDAPEYSAEKVVLLGIDESENWTRGQFLNHLLETGYPGEKLSTAELARLLCTRLSVGAEGMDPSHAQKILFAMHEAGVNNSVDATAVLKQLTKLNFDHPFDDTPDSPANQQAWHAAWKTACVLARTEIGFEVLLKFRQETHAPLAHSMDRDMLRTLLKAADRIDAELQQTWPYDPSPSAVDKRRQTLQQQGAAKQHENYAAQTADKVFSAARKFFDKVDQPFAAASLEPEDRLELFKKKLTPDEIEALFFDLQQFGNKKDKAAAQARYKKFTSDVALRDRKHTRSNLIQRCWGSFKVPLIGFRNKTKADRADEKSTASIVATADDNGRMALMNAVSLLKPGMRVAVSDGGHLSLTTERLSAAVSQFAVSASSAVSMGTGVAPVLSPSVDLKGELRKRKAMVELGCTDEYAWLFIGTADATERRAGIGLLGGVSTAGVTAGGTGSVQVYGKESTRPRGVLIQVARRPKADGSGYDDDAMRDRMEQIVGIVTGLSPEGQQAESPVTEKDHWNVLARSLLGARDVSVGWVDGVQEEKRQAASLGVIEVTGVPVPLPPPLSTSTSVSAPLSVKHANSVSLLRSLAGRIQTEKREAKRSFEVKVEVKVGASVSAATSNAPKSSISTGPNSIRLWDKQLYQTNLSLSRTLQTDGGRLNPRACVLDVDFPDAAAYEYATRNILGHEDHAGIKAVKTYLDPDRRSTQNPERLPKQVASAINQQFKQVASTVRSQLEFGDDAAQENRHIHRYMLTEQAARRIDTLQTHFDQWRGNPNVSAAKIEAVRQQVNARREAILDNPDSWRLDCLLTKERSEAHKFAPLWSKGIITALTLTDANAVTNRMDEKEVIHHRFEPGAGVKPSIDISMSSEITRKRRDQDGSRSLMGTPLAESKLTRAWHKTGSDLTKTWHKAGSKLTRAWHKKLG